jgi:uncharacterized membrane protein YkoI
MRPVAIAATAVLGTIGAAGAAIAIAAPQSPSAAAGGSDAGVGAAVKAVRTAAEAGRPFDLERDRHRGRKVWEVDVATGPGRAAELLISADGRQIVRRGTARPSRDAGHALAARVGLATALRTAGGRATGRLDDADIDRRGGRLVWSATFEQRGAETEVDVDAASGTVVDVRSEREDDD